MNIKSRNILIFLTLIVFVLGGIFLIKQNQTPQLPPNIINAGFESETPLEGWESAGITESGGYESEMRLTHPGGDVAVESTQVLNDISNGWYTLKVWVSSTGDQKEAYIALKDCGGDEVRASVPIVRPDRWMQVALSVKVTKHHCTIRLYSDTAAGEWVSFDQVEMVPGRAALTIMGADISSLKKSEDKGGLYTYEDGTPADALEILSAHGMNYARLRVWVDSPDDYHEKAQILEMAKRLKENKIKLLVDFHYSDSWADPGKQNKPEAWKDYDFEELKQAVYDHTYDVCKSLKDQGTPPDMMQIGNEINNGMLWPDGKADQWDNLAALLKEGSRAVKDCSPDTLVMLHIAEGGDNELARWWFDNAIEREVPFDLIGISYYPYWHGTLYDLQTNLNDIAIRYDKDIVVVETAYAFTREEDDTFQNIIRFQTTRGYEATPEGQLKMMTDIMNIVRAVPNGHGLGIFYWDATWTAVAGNGWDPGRATSGNGWENQALFDYENRALPAMNLFSRP
jgi:arabinogalactan endo-1,4-beta-galactosidase